MIDGTVVIPHSPLKRMNDAWIPIKSVHNFSVNLYSFLLNKERCKRIKFALPQTVELFPFPLLYTQNTNSCISNSEVTWLMACEITKNLQVRYSYLYMASIKSCTKQLVYISAYFTTRSQPSRYSKCDLITN